jgi:hypothetical protein
METKEMLHKKINIKTFLNDKHRIAILYTLRFFDMKLDEVIITIY